MFDVSFFELLVVGVVALLVIGPERLPGAIRTGALWFGRLRHAITETRSEIEKHIGADEIRRQLHNEQVMASLEKLKESRAALERDLLNYQTSINNELRDATIIDQSAEVTHDLPPADHAHQHLDEGSDAVDPPHEHDKHSKRPNNTPSAADTTPKPSPESH